MFSACVQGNNIRNTTRNLSRKLSQPYFVMHFYPGTTTTQEKSQLIQIYSLDRADVYDTHNIEHRTEPVSQSIWNRILLISLRMMNSNQNKLVAGLFS